MARRGARERRLRAGHHGIALLVAGSAALSGPHIQKKGRSADGMELIATRSLSDLCGSDNTRGAALALHPDRIDRYPDHASGRMLSQVLRKLASSNAQS